MTVVDQAARDRLVSELDRSFAVSAGAGTGKTSVLVSRVVRLIESGVAPRRIAAITFTEKAAAELTERVRDELEKRFADATNPNHAAIEAGLAAFADLTLSTIHAFCRTLLMAEALQADWPGVTELLAESLSAAGTETAFAVWRSEFDARHPDLRGVLRMVDDNVLRETRC